MSTQSHQALRSNGDEAENLSLCIRRDASQLVEEIEDEGDVVMLRAICSLLGGSKG
jgi:hypothetical protein